MNRERRRGLLVLLRLGNLPTVWTNGLAAAWLSEAPWAPVSWLLVLTALSALYLGGMVFNDLWDRRWDAAARATRPLVAGTVPLSWAYGLAGGLPVAGLLLLGLAPARTGLVAGLLLLAAILAYDRFHKQNPAAPLLMAACRLLACVVAATALGGQLALPLWLLAGAQFIYVLLLTLAARASARAGHARQPRVSISVLLAGISLVDGLLVGLLYSPTHGLVLGLAGFGLTLLAQRWAPGD